MDLHALKNEGWTKSEVSRSALQLSTPCRGATASVRASGAGRLDTCRLAGQT